MLLRLQLLGGVLAGSLLLAAGQPTVSVSGLAFDDLDLDASQLGGVVSWAPPGVTTAVTSYTVALATNALGAGLQSLGVVPLGTNQLSIGPDLPTGSFVYIVVYTQNSGGFQATPVALAFVDVAVQVSAVALTDQDLDANEVGGIATWSPPGSTVLVVSYSVYLGTNQWGSGRSQIGTALAVGTNAATIAANTALNLYGHLVVYAASSLAEESIPAALLIADTSATVSSLLFVDRDLDAGQLGGTVTWAPPSNVLQVLTYTVYWAQDAAGAVKASAGTLPLGTNALSVAAETLRASRNFVLVYSASALAEQSTPAVEAVVDTSATVSNLNFADQDLDAQEIGGGVTFTPPMQISLVAHYSLYLSLSSTGLGRSQVGADVPVATNLPAVPVNTLVGFFTYLAVYTKSALVEQSTPASLLISNTFGGVSAITFRDRDLDANEVGGTITWSEASDLSQVLYYTANFATNTAGSGLSQIGTTVPVYTWNTDVPVNTPKSTYTYILVYASSSLHRQDTPSAAAIVDTASPVTGLAFTDYDLDGAELQGTVTWLPPGNVQYVTMFRAYLARSAAGASRSQLWRDLYFAGPGTNAVAVAVNTPVQAYTHIVVYSASSLAEQTTPVAVPIVDTAARPANVSFQDRDLDSLDLGGTVTWDEPASVALVSYYVAYLAADRMGASRSKLGTNPMGVIPGTTQISVAPDTPLGTFTNVLVFSRSVLSEQTTPAYAAVVDVGITVPNVTFVDYDLDLGQVAGTVTWNAASDTTLVTHYSVFFSDGTSAGSQLGASLPVPTGSYPIVPDTNLGGYTYIAVFAQSTLARQSRPAGTVQVSDVQAPVRNLQFGDRDFQIGIISGVISWTPPRDTSRVTHYSAYRALDAIGTGKTQVGAELQVGTNQVNIPISTPLGSYTQILVYSKSIRGYQTTPTAVVIADTPVISTFTQWSIANAVPTTPTGDGRPSTPQVGMEWAVKELNFYSDSSCALKLSGTDVVSSGHTGKYFEPDYAFDQSLDTEWHSQCAPCAPLEAWVGLTIASVVRCVRWLQEPVAGGQGVGSVVLMIGRQELARATGLTGGQWEGLQYAAAGGGWQLIC